MSELEPEAITQQVATAAEQGKDLHDLVRDITLRALSRRALSMSEIKEVVGAVTEGVTLGLGRRAGEIKDAVRQALGGLDDAMKKTAEATKLAGQQLVAQGKEFGAQDLKPAIDDLKQMEEMFLNTVSKVAEAAVVGQPDSLTGEAVFAFVILKAGVDPVDELGQELRQHVAVKIGPIARPKSVMFTPDLPKTRSGKIMRRLLRDIATGRQLGDTTTLADAGVVETIREASLAGKDEE